MLAALLGRSVAAEAKAVQPEGSDAPSAVRTRQAREHTQAGIELDKAGDSLAALTEFQRAFELAPDFALLYNIAQEQYKLGRTAEAVETLRHYLTLGGKHVDEARRRRLTLQIEQYESLLPRLTIKSVVAGAEVFVDDHSVGVTPLPEAVKLSPGVHLVRLVFEGAEVTVSIKLTEEQHETIDLPEPQPPKPRDDTKAPPPPPPRGKTQPKAIPLAAVLTGSGLVVSGAAAVLAVWNQRNFEQWQTQDDELKRERNASDYLAQVDKHNAQGQSIENWGITSLALGIGGAALLAAGGTLLVLEVTQHQHDRSSPASKAQSSELSLVCSPSSGAVTWKGTF
jgi:hypothetical protein